MALELRAWHAVQAVLPSPAAHVRGGQGLQPRWALTSCELELLGEGPQLGCGRVRRRPPGLDGLQRRNSRGAVLHGLGRCRQSQEATVGGLGGLSVH